ncbi:MAG: type II toxin-antitoxin system VapC family toxin [Planctomycetia bacterium]|nr:type II toxin-antitoxin system VapC family toxin [Planctomycetia bacterium]
MKPKVYLETTIVSYLTAWRGRDIVMAAQQEITREWWTNRRSAFEVYVSQTVVVESSAGDKDAAQRRLEVLAQLPRLDITQDAERLARELMTRVPLPAKAQIDALHIAISAVNGMDFLLTWNCTHIANATLRSKIESVCRLAGYEPPVICTPQEMIEQGESDD